jgi:hypothetical protein
VSHEWRTFDWHLVHHGAEVAHRSEVSRVISETQSKLNLDDSTEDQDNALRSTTYFTSAGRQSAPTGAMIDS